MPRYWSSHPRSKPCHIHGLIFGYLVYYKWHFSFWNRIWKFQFLLNPIRIINGLGVFLKITSLFQGTVLVFGNLTRNSSMRQLYPWWGQRKTSAVLLQNKQKIIFKATFILNKIPIWFKLPSFFVLSIIQKMCDCICIVCRKRKKKRLPCFKSFSVHIEIENWSKKQICKVLCSCAGQLGSAATVNVSGICEAKSQWACGFRWLNDWALEPAYSPNKLIPPLHH